MTRFALAACAAALAAAAGYSPAVADTKVAYSCANGSILVADFGMSEGRVLLTFNHRRIVLSGVKAASGAKYTNDKTTFWTKDGTARLRDNGRETTCKVIEE